MEKFEPYIPKNTNSAELKKERELREHISGLEALHIGTDQLAYLVLVALGMKPATDLRVFKHNSPLEEVEKALTNADLQFARVEAKSSNDTVTTYAVAKDMATVMKLLATSSDIDKGDPAAFGRLMGYPETAIKAFVDHDALPTTHNDQLPLDIQFSPFHMAFSKTHTNEEIETVRNWNRALKKYAPKLFKRTFARGGLTQEEKQELKRLGVL